MKLVKSILQKCCSLTLQKSSVILTPYALCHHHFQRSKPTSNDLSSSFLTPTFKTVVPDPGKMDVIQPNHRCALSHKTYCLTNTDMHLKFRGPCHDKWYITITSTSTVQHFGNLKGLFKFHALKLKEYFFLSTSVLTFCE